MLGDAQLAHHLGGIQVDVEAFQQLGCLFVELSLVDHVEQGDAHRLHAEKHVLGDVEFADQVQLLVDEPQALVQGVLGRIDVHLLALDKDLALVGEIGPAQYFDQRALARSVFSQEHVYLPGTELEIYVIQRDYSWKLFSDAPHLDDILRCRQVGHNSLHSIFSQNRFQDASLVLCTPASQTFRST